MGPNPKTLTAIAPLDPVSIFDRAAKKSIKWNVLDSGSLTHDYSNDYSNIADNVKSWDYVPEGEEE